MKSTSATGKDGHSAGPVSGLLVGGRAILIKPAPAVFRKLVGNHWRRKNVTCLQIARSNTSGEADLYFGPDDQEGFMSTLCTSDNPWFRAARSSESVNVQTLTLIDLFRQHNVPSSPGLLWVSCDKLDFQRYRPVVIVTEEYEAEPDKHAEKYGLLIRSGHSLVQKIGYNSLSVDFSAVERKAPAASWLVQDRLRRHHDGDPDKRSDQLHHCPRA